MSKELGRDLTGMGMAGMGMAGMDLSAELADRIAAWLEAPYDGETIAAVKDLIEQGNIAELTDSFYKDLDFGTGGLRGILGVGTNRMNNYTVGKATQGLSNYLRKIYPDEEVKVAISYDSRNQSPEFSRLIASIFVANGFEVYLFEGLRPTPQLSFAIRQLGCHSAVMVTASHNPKEYNGYKAYWKDGGQLVAPHDKGVIECVNEISDPGQVLYDSEQRKGGGKAGKLHLLGKEMDEAYLQAVLALSIRPEIVQKEKDLKIVYSPIHGTGMTLVPQLLERWGFGKVSVVQEQSQPDGDFPTVVYPNPEESEAMTLALEEAVRIDADLVLATDPDADRVGMAIKIGKGTYELLNGNQIGSLLVDYVLSSMAEKELLNPNDYAVKTIVTTDLISDIAARYGIPCPEVLTGFKYIGELMTQQEGKMRFVVGGEESFGYLIGDLVRDKDAVISCAFLAEMAAYHKSRGKNLREALIELYLRHGFYKERLISLTKKGKKGAEEIQQIMKRLREGNIRDLGGIEVSRINDYLTQVSKDLKSGKESGIKLPKSDVLQFVTADGDVISVRPSGTEPKIKFYCSVRETLSSPAAYDKVEKELASKIDRMMESILR